MDRMLNATPFLWIQHSVAEAAEFYTNLLDGEILERGEDEQQQSATIRVAGQTLHLFNAGPYRDLTEAFSLMLTCSTQEEIDRLWEGFGEGGTPSRCGWVTDRFGVTWQVIPAGLRDWLGDPERGERVMATMLAMSKLEIAPLRAALDAD